MSIHIGHPLGVTFEQILKLIHTKQVNKMEQIKIRVWDKQHKNFYQSKMDRNSEYVRELLFSQEGEIYVREKDGGVDKLIHERSLEFENRFVKNLYVGIRDSNGKKYFVNDIVKFTHKQSGRGKPTYSFGVLLWQGDRLWIGSGPINDYTAVDSISETDLKNAEVVGNIYQDAKIIMGDLHED